MALEEAGGLEARRGVGSCCGKAPCVVHEGWRVSAGALQHRPASRCKRVQHNCWEALTNQVLKQRTWVGL